MKKSLLFFILFFVFLATMLTFAQAQSGSVNWWTMLSHDPTHSGYSTSSAPTTNQTAWTYAGSSGRIWSSPAVVDGKVYIGSWDNNVYCLDASTGNLTWTYKTGSSVSSSPAVADGRVYVGSQDNSVYCLDASTGTSVWKYATGDWVVSSPAVVGGKVYVGSRDLKVYCLDSLIGTLIWNYTTDNYVQSSPAVDDGKVYVGTQGNKIYCLDAATGALVWTYTTGGVVFSSPAVSNGKVYVGSQDGNIYCLDALTGTLMWSYATGSAVYGGPAVANGKIYVGSDDGNIYCLDALFGNLVWAYRTGFKVSANPSVADGKVYVGSQDGNMYCLDYSNGALIWKYTTGNMPAVHSSAAVANGAVYVGSQNSSKSVLYAFAAGATPKKPASSEYVAKFNAVPWVPPTETAIPAAAATAIAVGIAATVQASVSNQIAAHSGKAAGKLVDLLPDGFKRWLEEYVSSKQKSKIAQKKPSLMPTKTELSAYLVSLLVLTASFSYVKAGDFTQILYVLPFVLVTVVIVEFAKTLSQVVVARSLGVWTEHKLWYFGLAMLLVSTFVFGVPFSAPTRNVYFTPKLTQRLNAVVSSMAILVSLAFAALFLGLLVAGFTLIGSTGFGMCIIMGFIDTFPVNPLNGKAIYQHKKAAWAAIFVLMISIYVAWLLIF